MSESNHVCSSCQSRRQFLTTGLILGAGLWLPSLSIAGAFRQMDGDILINGRRAHRQSKVYANSTISTQQGATTAFVIGNNAFMLRPNSKVQFSPVANSRSAISTLRLITGGLLSVFGPGPKKLITSTATIGIRGTGVYMEAQENTSYVCLCYGKVDLSANSQTIEPQLLEAKHHEGKNIAKEGTIESSGMHNHNDEELVLLEDLVGRKVPF